MGVLAAHAHGAVGHNNLWSEALLFGEAAARRVAETALVDLLVLSHSDVLIASSGYSTFPKAAKAMRACPTTQQRRLVYLHYRPLLGPVSRALFGGRTPAPTSLTNSSAPAPDCVRDCYGAGEWVNDQRAAPMHVPLWANPRATPLKQFSAACLAACKCFFIDAFGGSRSHDGVLSDTRRPSGETA